MLYVRLSGVHCEITKNDGCITLLDCSTNGTYVNDNKVGKDKTINLQNGDKIHLLHKSKVKESETMGFFFTISKFDHLKRKEDEKEDKKQEEEEIKKKIEKMKKVILFIY